MNIRLTYKQRQKSSGGGGGRGRGPQDDRPSYTHQGPDSSTNQPPQTSSSDGTDPYAQCEFLHLTPRLTALTPTGPY